MDHGSSLIQLKNHQSQTLAKNPIEIPYEIKPFRSFCVAHAHLKRDEQIGKIFYAEFPSLSQIWSYQVN